MAEEDVLVSTDEAILDSIGEGDEQATTPSDGEEDTGEQPVVNKVLTEAVQRSRNGKLMVPKTSLEGTERSLQRLDGRDGFTRLDSERRIGPIKQQQKQQS